MSTARCDDCIGKPVEKLCPACHSDWVRIEQIKIMGEFNNTPRGAHGDIARAFIYIFIAWLGIMALVILL
jgi:hypothetical protein